jgi:hypothetical protein
MSRATRHCQRCKKEIDPERLEALPETTLCSECVKPIGDEYELVITQENLGKPGSLKKNRGGVAGTRVKKKLPPGFLHGDQ